MRKIKRLLVIVGIIILAFLIGVLVVNSVLMKILVKAGSVQETPSIVGLSLYDSRQALEKEGLSLIVVGERYSEMMEKSYILSQKPSPSQVIKKDQLIEVIVSSGPEDRILPDLSNSTIRQTELILSRLGLHIGEIARIHSDEMPKDRVIAQNPPPNNKLKVGKAVNLLVSYGPWQENFLMPRLVGLNLDKVRTALLRLGMGIGAVEYIFNTDIPPGTIITQNPPTGSVIAREADISLQVTRGITYGQEDSIITDTTKVKDNAPQSLTN